MEIGCGWGGFAEFFGKNFNGKLTAITISKKQHAFTSERIQHQDLGDRIEVRLQDYCEVTERFDRIVSIEMFEAVGERYWGTFFSKLSERLNPGGLAGIQTITLDDAYFAGYRKTQDFIQRYIFPGGMLPSPSAFLQARNDAGLNTVSERSLGGSYAGTLRIWREDFLHAWHDLAAVGFDEPFKRMWTWYLAYCETGFRYRFTDVKQYVLAR